MEYQVGEVLAKELEELKKRIEYLEEDVSADRDNYEKQFDELFSAFARLSAAIQINNSSSGRMRVKGFKSDNNHEESNECEESK